MSVSVCIVSHNNIGYELLEAIKSMFDISHIQIQVISIPSDLSPTQLESYQQKVTASVKNCNPQNEKLILCDLYGATPYNLIKHLIQKPHIKVVSGLNLGMLLKALQDINKPINDIALAAQNSAIKSIIIE